MIRQEILTALRQKMKALGMDALVIPTGDYHGSEYISSYFKTVRFVTGFTGSASTVAVTADEAALWTDGRYFLQASRELEGSGIELMRTGMPGVPSLAEYLEDKLPEGGTLGFDGRVVTCSQAAQWADALKKKHIRFLTDHDPVGSVWADRPAQSFHDAFILGEEYSGESAASKIARVRAAMKEQGADCHFLTSLDDICWLLNVRGDDVPSNPVVFSFVMITPEEALWFLDRKAVNASVQEAVEDQGVSLRDYDGIWQAASELSGSSKVLLDPAKTSFALEASLPDSAEKIHALNPSTLMKAVKNETEQKMLRIAHEKDGVAMVKFLYWLKHLDAVEGLTEWDAAEYLKNCRTEAGAFELSFGTIAAMGANASVIHYGPTPEKCSPLKPEGFLLVDSGGQYKEGTTDITRTITMGPLSDAEKLHYTAVLRSMLDLGSAKFLDGCTGRQLDILARIPVWEMGLDYRHGTGHGIGYCLNVHEGPNSFRWKAADRRETVMEAGMVTSDEPGLYMDNAYGIRTENALLCVEAETTEYGRFLAFEHLTLCPIDTEAIIKDELSEREKQSLNTYHAMVYERLKGKGLTEEEEAWLREVTLPL